MQESYASIEINRILKRRLKTSKLLSIRLYFKFIKFINVVS